MHLLKPGSKRRRTRAQMELDKEEEELKKEATERQAKEISELKQRLGQAEARADMNEHYRQQLSKMHDAGVIEVDENN